ncbi:excinuclease ABC subunit UvrB [Mycoplasmopsis synoviae]|uniref:UvrABC system protein B n=1 Tax=Mycoplasmopsis synoviae TaxID=2109 RepID=A0AAX3EZR9_MYCSY|nr:excinuclease ABC subunit UvrB [Mycoplasmopsis synoviae]MBD5788516.1 excinuclease ABC subunit B [Mycoplasmopsis synoviae GX11-T]QGL45248.1 excinuclease ABC subunit UvrB [Mycoplasmopsis synoviae]QXV99529.1 excinuclease ABC subunit UvrB [Mycoplasmopsis synoviae]UBM43705.1 excinuclease ABC subunit UvrB [Mycoplasmopsis synoviae]UBX97681.1 excinuclease ABC subunit UvrB [Mycoplasmopsis synoviae]
MKIFKLNSNFTPQGDQPKAINELVQGIKNNRKDQVLLGVTGSGKTFTIANVIKEFDRPVIILSHNKTLASQLYSELKAFFPENAVEYFISYFDYYRPEAYKANTDTYIEKDSATNQQIEILRLSAYNSLLTRKDVIVVASVSAIYGALNPEVYNKSFYNFYLNQKISVKDFIIKLTKNKYERNDLDVVPGRFAVKGDLVFIAPADSETKMIRVSFSYDEIEEIAFVHPLEKTTIKKVSHYTLSPGDAYATDNSIYSTVIPQIQEELKERVKYYKDNNQILEATRINQRTNNDIDDMKEFGHCKGIENYSMYLDGRTFGQRPYTILDYFPENSLMFIDESHMSLPQIRAMHAGDRSRKNELVKYAFRLPSALENRPLTFDEFENSFSFNKIYISATPEAYEINKTAGAVTTLYVRPTGLIDPEIFIYPKENQIERIYNIIMEQRKTGEKTLVLTVTKRLAEEISNYFIDRKIKAAYIHSDHETFVRNEILRKLRMGTYEVVIGINLLREGIDIPEVSKVIILDADSNGFLRNTKSLIQIVGRAARNANGQAILFADTITSAIKEMMEDNKIKRKIQMEYNQKYRIVPKTIIKPIRGAIYNENYENAMEILLKKSQESKFSKNEKKALNSLIEDLEIQMKKAAKEYDYEEAIRLRDMIHEIKQSQSNKGK